MPELPRSPYGRWERDHTPETPVPDKSHRRGWIAVSILVAVGLLTVASQALTGGEEVATSSPSVSSSPSAVEALPEITYSEALKKEATAQLHLVVEGDYDAANKRLRSMEVPKGCEVLVAVVSGNSPRVLGMNLDYLIQDGQSKAPFPYVYMGVGVVRTERGLYGNVLLVSCPRERSL